MITLAQISEMKTETLLLSHFMGGYNKPEDYVDWVVERLGDGLDTPNLRILAGFNPRFEWYEIEHYFIKTCKELNIELPSQNAEPREIAGLVRSVYELEEISAEMAMQMMVKLFWKSENPDPLFAVWLTIEEELVRKQAGLESIAYPHDALESHEVILNASGRFIEKR